MVSLDRVEFGPCGHTVVAPSVIPAQAGIHWYDSIFRDWSGFVFPW